MTRSRRSVLGTGGAFLAGLLTPAAVRAEQVTEIAMRGNADGSDVWYDPIGLHIAPGRTIRWTNRDPGNAHTATAYHPRNGGHPCRIPAAAPPWDSDYLLPGETFSVTFQVEGVYDYFCVPHEHAGMVGRIVVGRPDRRATEGQGAEPIPEIALRAFPAIDAIMRKGVVRRS
jgi:plastocyanin